MWSRHYYTVLTYSTFTKQSLRPTQIILITHFRVTSSLFNTKTTATPNDYLINKQQNNQLHCDFAVTALSDMVTHCGSTAGNPPGCLCTRNHFYWACTTFWLLFAYFKDSKGFQKVLSPSKHTSGLLLSRWWWTRLF